MIIESARLILRVITMDDIEKIHFLHSFKKVCEFNTTLLPKNLDETKESVEPFVKEQSSSPRKYYTFTVNLKSSGEFLGIAGINLSLDKFNIGEVYYELLPEFWNQGYATEACKRLIIFGFEDLNLHRIEANTDADNHGSVRVLKKCGMIREGLRRKFLPIQGKWKDGILFGKVNH